MNANQLASIAGIESTHAAQWADPITLAIVRAKLDNPKRVAMFVAQLAHESAAFTRLSESLNYTPEALLRIWPSRFTPGLAEEVGRTKTKAADKVRIAQIAYGGRMGNAPEPSMDGWTYRGRGPIQITGRSNYARAGAALNIDLINNPDLLLLPIHGAAAAAFFWQSNGLNRLSDAGDVTGVTRVINGGLNGLQDRIERYNRACAALGV